MLLRGGRSCLTVPVLGEECLPGMSHGTVSFWAVGAPCVKPSRRQLCLQRTGLSWRCRATQGKICPSTATCWGLREPSRGWTPLLHRAARAPWGRAGGCDAARAGQRAVPGLGQSFGGIGAVPEGSCPVQRGTGRGWDVDGRAHVGASSRTNSPRDSCRARAKRCHRYGDKQTGHR